MPYMNKLQAAIKATQFALPHIYVYICIYVQVYMYTYCYYISLIDHQATHTNHDRVHKQHNVQSDISLSAMHSQKNTNCRCSIVH